jgi:Domain of unknown function (DUF4338)
MLACMNVILTYRGRSVTQADVAFLRQLIADNPTLNRQALSQEVCRIWGWRQRNGVLKDAICRSLMLQLHRAGQIELPPPLRRPANHGSRRWRIAPVSIDCSPLRVTLRDLPSLTFRQVRRTPQEPLFNALLHKHHELGYRQPVGEHLKYLVYADQWLVAALAWSSAAHGLTCRDRFIGWSPEARRRNRHLLAYNMRFLVPPWVQVPHLASHVLGRMARRLSADWQQVYGHPVCFLETFVDPARHRGTCYRAANWIVLGQTFGRGHRCPTSRPNRPPKLVLGYPLVKRFRELLAEQGLESMEVRQHEG